ncbi:MAG: protein kinase domain-containing protein, partial [Gemmataceae bacterium]
MSLFQHTQGHTDSDHPSLEQLNAFAVGQLTEHDSNEVEQHLAVCTLCNQKLESSPDDAFVQLLQQGDSPVRGGLLSAVGPSRALRFVPGYTLLELLGQGGMGVVWKARQDGLNRLVALKRLRSAGTASAEVLARFRREAESVARLRHANIVQIYEVGEQDGEPYLALEYVGGGSLARKLADGMLLPAQAAVLVETLARAMHHAHENGIVHRDLKPDNILLDDNGAPKIGDFGLAKQLDEASAHTRTGTVLGTPSYMAPEQAASEQTNVGPLADVYALGAILYETLTGRPPFRGPTVLDTLAQVREREAVPPRQLQPNIPRDLQTICLKCLHKEPRRRYGSALALADDLRRFATGEPIQARPVGRLERLLKWMRRKPTLAILAGIVLIIPVAAIAALLWHNDRLRREVVRADSAERNAQENYEKSRKTLLSMLQRLQHWHDTGEKKTGEMDEGVVQDSLAYLETVLDKGDRGDPRVRADVAELLSKIALIQIYQGQREPARANFTKSFHLWEQLADEHPEVSVYLANLANCYRTMHAFLPGDERQKLAWLEKALQLREDVSRRDADYDFSHPLDLAQCHHDMATRLQLAKRLPEAEKHFDRAIALMTEIGGKEPQNLGIKLGLADSYSNLGQLYHFTGRMELAENMFERADALYDQLMHEEIVLISPTISRSSLAINWGYLYL